MVDVGQAVFRLDKLTVDERLPDAQSYNRASHPIDSRRASQAALWETTLI